MAPNLTRLALSELVDMLGGVTCQTGRIQRNSGLLEDGPSWFMTNSRTDPRAVQQTPPSTPQGGAFPSRASAVSGGGALIETQNDCATGVANYVSPAAGPDRIVRLSLGFSQISQLP